MCCSTRNSQATINYFMFNDFVNILFPKTCIGCSRALFKQETFLCLHCKSELPEAQYKANTENPASQLLAGRTYFNTCLPLYYYYRGGKVQKIVKEMKYGNQPELAQAMGKMMGRNMVGKFEPDQIHAIIPVPLHPKREKARGYNQSYFLSKGIAEIMEVPVLKDAIKRNVNTSSQTNKSRLKRWNNVSSIFSLQNSECLTGKHILLVDDVITTGSTLESCCTVLNDVEDITISIATLATA